VGDDISTTDDLMPIEPFYILAAVMDTNQLTEPTETEKRRAPTRNPKLPRMPNAKNKERGNKILTMLENVETTFTLSANEIAQLQLEDSTLAKSQQQADVEWIIYNDCLHHVQKSTSSFNGSIQLVLPETMRACHNDLLASRVEYFKTLQTVLQWSADHGQGRQASE